MSNSGYEYNFGYNASGFGFGGSSGGGGGAYEGYSSFGGIDPMGGSSFDAAGGYMNTTENKSAEKKQVSGEKKNITPVSISLVTKSNDDDVFKADGRELDIIRIIGNIVSVDHQSTSTVYRISDGTGVIECKHWIEKEGAAVSTEQFRENMLVKVHGNLRRFDGVIHVLVYDMKSVDDLNELTHHLLECVYIRLQRTRGPLATPTTGSMSVPMQTSSTPMSRVGGMMASQIPSRPHQPQMWVNPPTRTLYPEREQLAQVNQAFCQGIARNASKLVVDENAFQRCLQSGLLLEEAQRELVRLGLTFPLEVMVATVSALCDNGILYETRAVGNVKYYALTSSIEVEELARGFVQEG